MLARSLRHREDAHPTVQAAEGVRLPGIITQIFHALALTVPIRLASCQRFGHGNVYQ